MIFKDLMRTVFCISFLTAGGTIIAQDVTEGTCRSHEGQQYICEVYGGAGWVATSNQSMCPAATPADTCSGQTVPGVISPAGESGPGGSEYGPTDGYPNTPSGSRHK